MESPKRGRGRPALPESERARPQGYSVRPVTDERLEALASRYGIAKSAMLESLVEDAFVSRRWPDEPREGYAPVSGMRAEELIGTPPAYTIWNPIVREIAGYRFACGCDIRGDGSSYAWVPCGHHVEAAVSQTVDGNVRLKPIPPEFRGGFLRSFPLPNREKLQHGLEAFERFFKESFPGRQTEVEHDRGDGYWFLERPIAGEPWHPAMHVWIQDDVVALVGVDWPGEFRIRSWPAFVERLAEREPLTAVYLDEAGTVRVSGQKPEPVRA